MRDAPLLLLELEPAASSSFQAIQASRVTPRRADRAAASPRLSAGVVIVRDSHDGPRFLLLRAYRNWDFPKGLVEAGEDPLAAALREAREEAGVDDLELAWGRDYYETPAYAGNKVARYYLARTRREDVTLGLNPFLGRPEHHEFRWVDAAAAAALTVPRIRAVVAWAAAKLAERR